MPRRPKIGDLIEIPTRRGFAYAQYTHKHPEYGALLRVLDGFFGQRPSDFGLLVTVPHRFVVFLPLGAAIRRGIFAIVAQHPVPEPYRQFPTFRSTMADPRTGQVHVWWLWDGEREWQTPALTPAEAQLPFLEIINDTLLIERLEQDWTPSNEVPA